MGRGRMIKRSSAALIGLSLLIAAGTMLYYNFSEIGRRLGPTPFKKTAMPALEDVEAIAWIKDHTNLSDVVVCYHDPVYFLYSGRKTSRSLPMEEWVDWREDRTAREAVENSVFRTLQKDNGRYFVVTSTDFESEDQTGQYQRILGSIIDSHPERFAPVFSSSNARSKIFRIENNQ